jgi:hypothetical protein
LNEDVLVTLWNRRLRWSKLASQVKRSLDASRIAALALSVTGALLETAAGTLLRNSSVWRPWCAGTGAVSLAIATFITTRFLTSERIRRWTRARSVSEAIKHQVYAFRAGTAPFSGGDALLVLQTAIQAIEANVLDLERYLAGTEISESPPPPPLGPDEYVKQRIFQQINNYYRPKARQFSKRLQQLRGIEIILGLTATVLASIATFLSTAAPLPATVSVDYKSDFSSWVAVLTTTAGALAAHIAANRYEFIVMSYFATARRLEDLVNDWKARGSPAGSEPWTHFVDACENAISVENESWMAKWAEQQSSG